MPRNPRQKPNQLPHHIMSRSIPELELFLTNQDRDYYLSLIVKSAKIHQMVIVAYCLMSNHVHLLIHPMGGDISIFMKEINHPYAKYYNYKYNRRGPLFGGRFKNIIIKDEAQFLRASTYIHNNPKDLPDSVCMDVKTYNYSSIKEYIHPEDSRKIAQPQMIWDLLNSSTKSLLEVRNAYRHLLDIQGKGLVRFNQAIMEAGEVIKFEAPKVLRKIDPHRVEECLARYLGIKDDYSGKKSSSIHSRPYWSLLAISLRIFCGMTISEMKNLFHCQSISTIGYLARIGYKAMMVNSNLYDDLIQALS